MLLVNVSESWYSDRGLHEIQKSLNRPNDLSTALQFGATKAASKWLGQLSMPSWSSFTHLDFLVLALGTLMVIGLCLLPPMVK